MPFGLNLKVQLELEAMLTGTTQVCGQKNAEQRGV